MFEAVHCTGRPNLTEGTSGNVRQVVGQRRKIRIRHAIDYSVHAGVGADPNVRRTARSCAGSSATDGSRG
jgi:hypothetical protein